MGPVDEGPDAVTAVARAKDRGVRLAVAAFGACVLAVVMFAAGVTAAAAAPLYTPADVHPAQDGRRRHPTRPRWHRPRRFPRNRQQRASARTRALYRHVRGDRQRKELRGALSWLHRLRRVDRSARTQAAFERRRTPSSPYRHEAPQARQYASLGAFARARPAEGAAADRSEISWRSALQLASGPRRAGRRR